MTYQVVEISQRKRKSPKKAPERRAKKKTRNLSQSALKRLWGLPATAWMRYKGIKGIYWYHFSRYVRNRDVRVWGRCISCGIGITLESTDAGHFIPANGCGRDLLFDERNVNAECKRCNGFDEMHLLGYADGLDMRYGEGTARELRNRHDEYKNGPVVKDWKKEEYEQKLLDLGIKPLQEI